MIGAQSQLRVSQQLGADPGKEGVHVQMLSTAPRAATDTADGLAAEGEGGWTAGVGVGATTTFLKCLDCV